MYRGTWEPRISVIISMAGETARHAGGDAGSRCRKKRMSFCNGMDTGLNVTRLERELTSVGHSYLVLGQVLCREKIKRTFLEEKSK